MGGSEVRCARHHSKPRADDCAVLRVLPWKLEAGACRAAVDMGSLIKASERVTAGALLGEVTVVSADPARRRQRRCSVSAPRRRSSVAKRGGLSGASSRVERVRRGSMGVSDIVAGEMHEIPAWVPTIGEF